MSVPAVSVRIARYSVRTARPRGRPLMAQSNRKAHSDGVAPDPGASIVIDCDDCAVRGPGCRDCVISVILGVPETLSQDERAALEVLADVGLAPRLRLVPIHRAARGSGVA
jgi:hypothetical protein